MLKNIIKLGLLIAFALVGNSTFAQIKIGDNATSVDARSILELETSTKAIYLPRLTTVERDAQTGWKAGMFIYNSTLNCVQFFEGTNWNCLASTPGTPDLDGDASNELNTGFSVNGTGDSLVITDAGTRYAVAVGSILDTTSLSNRINTKVNISDTAAMLLPYLLEVDQIDTTSLSNRINTKVNISDTVSMLLPYLREADQIDTTSLSNRINTKVNISDTAAMLAPYLREADQIDTTSLSSRINEKVNISDTAAMLAPYLLEADQIDTASLSNRIDVNLQAIIDSSLAVRGELNDTASLIRSLIVGHIAADGDTDPTNERNTGFAVVGTNLRITDAGGNLDVPLSDIIDTTSLSNRINANNQGILDSAANVRSALLDTALAIRGDMGSHEIVGE